MQATLGPSLSVANGFERSALARVDGRLPFELPDRFVRSSSDSGGDLTSWFTDDGNEFTATIEVRTVDRAGKLSEHGERARCRRRGGMRMFDGGCGTARRCGMGGRAGGPLVLATKKRLTRLRRPRGRRHNAETVAGMVVFSATRVRATPPP